MVAITLETARNVAVLVALGLVVGAFVAAWIIRKLVAKALTAVVLAGLAVVVWSQKDSLDECADRVKTTLAAGAVDDTTCTFLGRDVTVKSPRT